MSFHFIKCLLSHYRLLKVPTNQQINLLYSIRQLPIYLNHTLITIYNYVNTILAIFHKDKILISDNLKKVLRNGDGFLGDSEVIMRLNITLFFVRHDIQHALYRFRA